MKTRLLVMVLGLTLVVPVVGLAHGGGKNDCGCHIEKATGKCHCHPPEGNGICGCKKCQPDTCSAKKPDGPEKKAPKSEEKAKN
jgi:hypothetical protein